MHIKTSLPLMLPLAVVALSFSLPAHAQYIGNSGLPSGDAKADRLFHTAAYLPDKQMTANKMKVVSTHGAEPDLSNMSESSVVRVGCGVGAVNELGYVVGGGTAAVGCLIAACLFLLSLRFIVGARWALLWKGTYKAVVMIGASVFAAVVSIWVSNPIESLLRTGFGDNGTLIAAAIELYFCIALIRLGMWLVIGATSAKAKPQTVEHAVDKRIHVKQLLRRACKRGLSTISMH